MKRNTVVTLVFGAVLLLTAALVQAAPVDTVNVLIGFDRTPGPNEQALVRAFGGNIKFSYHIIPAIAASVPQTALPGLMHNPRVTIVEPDVAIHAVGDYRWDVTQIGADVVQQSGVTGQGVKVAIIDTGFDYNHPAFADVSYGGGYDFVNGDDDPMDDAGHGTHVAGTIAAEYVDANGMTGVAPGVEIYALKVLDSTGSGSFANVIAALEWATGGAEGSTKVDITNNSYGSSGNPGILVQLAFDLAYNSDGVLNIAAAGNSGNRRGTGDNVIYPARYESAVAVAATDSNNERAYFSSTGSTVELAAPGAGIYSTLPNNSYATWNGTSMACPHVVGVAALVKSAHPQWTAAQIRAQLQDTAQDLGNPDWYGFGLVDAIAAVGVNSSPNHTPVAADDFASTMENTAVTINVLANDTDPDNDSLSVLAVTQHQNDGGIASINADNTITYTPADGFSGDAVFDYTVSDGNGGTDTATVSVTVNPANPPSSTMSTSIDLDITEMQKGKNTFHYVIATVTVVDSSGNPVDNVTVNGHWSGLVHDTDSGVTGSGEKDGTVSLDSDATKKTGDITFTIDSVVGSGYAYDEGSSVISKTIAIP